MEYIGLAPEHRKAVFSGFRQRDVAELPGEAEASVWLDFGLPNPDGVTAALFASRSTRVTEYRLATLMAFLQLLECPPWRASVRAVS